MYFTPYVKQDGYWESICYLREGLGPVLKCRAVLRSDGNYDSIVRDYSTGKMVASKIGCMIPNIAKNMAKCIAMKFILSEADDHRWKGELE